MSILLRMLIYLIRGFPQASYVLLPFDKNSKKTADS